MLRSRLGFSSQLAKRVRLYGTLHINGKESRMIDRVTSGDHLEVRFTADNEIPEDERLEDSHGIHLVYQDEWLIAADKPAGLLTHPSFLGETRSLTSLLSPYTLHPVSRLDRDTSGLVLLGRNGYIHDLLARAAVRKRYIGLVHGTMPEREGMIDAPIRRSADSIITREVGDGGQAARTLYKVLGDYRCGEGCVFQQVGFELLTGRTHQIRVHCLHAGAPLLGDSLYLQDRLLPIDIAMGRQALHAKSLDFIHPVSGEELHLTSPLPPDIADILSKSLPLKQEA